MSYPTENVFTQRHFTVFVFLYFFPLSMTKWVSIFASGVDWPWLKSFDSISSLWVLSISFSIILKKDEAIQQFFYYMFWLNWFFLGVRLCLGFEILNVTPQVKKKKKCLHYQKNNRYYSMLWRIHLICQNRKSSFVVQFEGFAIKWKPLRKGKKMKRCESGKKVHTHLAIIGIQFDRSLFLCILAFVFIFNCE